MRKVILAYSLETELGGVDARAPGLNGQAPCATVMKNDGWM